MGSLYVYCACRVSAYVCLHAANTYACVKSSFSRPYVDLWDAYKLTLLSWVSHLAWRVLWCFSVCGQWLGVINIIMLLWAAKGSCALSAALLSKFSKCIRRKADLMLSCFAGWAGSPPWEQKLWPSPLGSTGEADTGKSGAAEAAAVWTFCKLGTRGVVGFSCKMLSAENAESLPAFEGQLTSGLFPVRSFKEVKQSASALLSAHRTQA